jgi:co-chaperonin GroES (HSP10)
MKLLIAGTCRDIEKYWKNTEKSLDIIFNSIEDYICVIVESNSSDNSLNCIKKWAENDKGKRIIISLGILDENQNSRTMRIAKGRNTYMKYFKDNNLFYNSEYEYMLVVDLDDILNIESNFKDQLNSCFKINDWDAMTANRVDKYYDAWALRSNSEILNCDYDCNSNEGARTVIQRCKFTGRKIITSIPENKRIQEYRRNPAILIKNIPRNYGFIECTSAFCGMALYKINKIKDRLYNGDKTCEHVSFNDGLKMYINCEFISG